MNCSCQIQHTDLLCVFEAERGGKSQGDEVKSSFVRCLYSVVSWFSAMSEFLWDGRAAGIMTIAGKLVSALLALSEGIKKAVPFISGK